MRPSLVIAMAFASPPLRPAPVAPIFLDHPRATATGLAHDGPEGSYPVVLNMQL